jgi:trimeric autotransporter adhesin
MSKFSIFSVLLVGSLLVAPMVTANNYAPINKSASADNIQSSISSLSSINIPSSDKFSSVNSFDSSPSSSLVSSSSLQSSSRSDSKSSFFKKTKIITDVKPVKLNAQSANWWKEADTFSGGNSADLGNDAINTQIQAKLQNQCPNIYDSVSKTINETNLATCTAINNLPLQKIAVIDSGVTPNAEMIPYVDQVNSWNFFTSTNYPAICMATSTLNFYTLVQGNTTIHYCKEKGTQTDTDYHGTAVALTAIRTYENSLLKNRIKIIPLSLRTLDTINISEAIDEVVRAGDIKTINLSIGSPYNLTYVETSVNDANAAGISVYASSGNCAVYSAANCDYNGNTVQDLPEETNNAPDYPASYVNSIMVGSNNYSDNSIGGIIRATYSNFAKTLKANFVMAPIGNSGITLPCFVSCQGATTYAYLGTSFAAPQAAALDGLVSRFSDLMKQNLGQPNEKVLVSTDTPKTYVTTNTTDILATGNDLESGTGLINLKKINDKIVTQLQTLNIPISSSPAVVSSSSLLASSATIVPSSSVVASSSALPLSVNIPGNIGLSSDNLNYIVDFATTNFVPTPGSNHVHFYYDTEANTVLDKMYSSPAPYNLAVSTKPAGATQLCIIVANASHQIIPNSGVCKLLPVIQAPISSSSIIASSSNVQSSSTYQSSAAVVSSSSATSSVPQATPASSSQVTTSSQTISSSIVQSSSLLLAVSSQSIVISSSSRVNSTSSVSSTISSQSVSTTNSGGVISIITGVISNIINTITGANANLNGSLNSLLSVSSVANQSSIDVDGKIKIPATTVPLKNAEDAAFAGLVNNPNGVTDPNNFGIKENGVKSPEVKVETQSDRITTDSKTNFSEKINQGSKQITSSSQQSSATSSITYCDKGINEKGLSNKTNQSSDCGNIQLECKKGWDGTIKGGSVVDENEKLIIFRDDGTAGDKIPGDKSASNSNCNPIGVNPQSDFNSGNDLGKYIPIVVMTLVGIVGALGIWSLKGGVVSGAASLLGGSFPGSAAKHAINTKGAGSPPGITDSISERVNPEPAGNNCPAGGNRAINTKGMGTNSSGISEEILKRNDTSGWNQMSNK